MAEPQPAVLDHLGEEDLVSVESDVRTRVVELGRKLELESREIVIFIHRKFAIVAFKW